MKKKKRVPLPSLTQFSYYPAVCHPPLAWILLYTKSCEKAGRGELGYLARTAGVSARKKGPLSITFRPHHLPRLLPPLPTSSRHGVPMQMTPRTLSNVWFNVSPASVRV